MNYLFDTNILVHFIRGSPIAVKIIDELDPFGKINIPWFQLCLMQRYCHLFQFSIGGIKRKNSLKTC